MNSYNFVSTQATRSTKSLLSYWALLPALAMGLGCGDAEQSSVEERALALSTPAVVASFDPAQGQLPESVTADNDGNFYLSMSNTVQKLSPNGTLSLYAQLPTPAGNFAAGVKFGPNGYLYVASAGFDPSQGAAGLYKVSPGRTVSLVTQLDPTGFPNDIAFDADDNALVTDPFLGRVYKVDRSGNSSVWIQDARLLGNPANPALVIAPFGVDGIAFDKNKRNLYLGNLDSGSIYRVAVGSGCAPGPLQLWVTDPKLRGADGIAFDKKGNLLVAVNAQDQIAQVAPNGSVSVVAAGAPLDSPSSVVFGQHGSDKKNLYISNFAIARALGVKPGAPAPSLTRIGVQFGGQDIP